MATKRKRTYRIEYQRRVANGLAKGLSRRAARGHPGPHEAKTSGPVSVDRSSALEQAFSLVKRGGASQRQAAKAKGVPVERLRRFMYENAEVNRLGRRWIVVDRRPVPVAIATGGKTEVVMAPYDAARDISRHWIAINQFLDTGNEAFLAPFVRKGIRDVGGRFWAFETRPNVLREAEATGALSFLDLYVNVTGEG